MIRRHTISIQHAIEGIYWLLQSQPNYRIHLSLSILSIAGGIFFDISYIEWLFIISFIFIGLTIEGINSAIEKVGDAIDTNYNEHIKYAKDAAAGAMLIFAVGAILVAGIVFIPKIVSLIQ